MHAHNGLAYNVSIHPGQVLLYESLSVLHGQPAPLKGRFSAYIIYIHFIPLGFSWFEWEQKRKKKLVHPLHAQHLYNQKLELFKTQSITDSLDKKKTDITLPHFISSGSIEADRWKQQLRYKPVSRMVCCCL